MKTIFKLAFRNIWRNKRRTLITAAAIAFAVFIASLMTSLQKGVWDKVTDNSVNMFFGYGQIHSNGYWKEQTLNKAFDYTEEVKNAIKNTPNIEALVPRIENFALASEGNLTRGIMLNGIDPIAENNMTSLATRMTKGEYLNFNDNAVIIAAGVAKKLKLVVGDTLVVIGQGYHGVNAAGKFPIKGIFSFGIPDLNKRLVYLPLPAAQALFGAEGKITTLALNIPNKEDVPQIISDLNNNLDTAAYEVMSWEEMIPELMEARALDEGSSNLTLYILYMLISFGIFGTVLMMTKEREYEFGILTAIGMKRILLAAVVWIETLLVGLLGSSMGILLSIPIVYYLKVNPIPMESLGEGAAEAYEKFGMEANLPATFDFNIFLNQAFIIFIITSLMAIYPLWKIRKLKPVEAMRG
ncbi:MAG: putative ABC transport system permease protein [Saprospiraceae bacterium]|jgi:putative ABC transport system permease protein